MPYGASSLHSVLQRIGRSSNSCHMTKAVWALVCRDFLFPLRWPSMYDQPCLTQNSSENRKLPQSLFSDKCWVSLRLCSWIPDIHAETLLDCLGESNEVMCLNLILVLLCDYERQHLFFLLSRVLLTKREGHRQMKGEKRLLSGCEAHESARKKMAEGEIMPAMRGCSGKACWNHCTHHFVDRC